MLSWSALCRIVPQLVEHGIETVTLVGGGDPSQYESESRRLPDVAELLHQYGIHTFLVTNLYAIGDASDIARILATVDGVRVSFYEALERGEPEDKHARVAANLDAMLDADQRLGTGVYFNLANLVAYNSARSYDVAVQLATSFGVPITPRPFISIQRSARAEVAEETTLRVLDVTMENYQRIAPAITVRAPIAAREFLERILVYSLPFDRTCAVTARGLVGKLRTSGDLFRCGQLSTVPAMDRRARGFADEILFRNVADRPADHLAVHVDGYQGLPMFNVCPTCRETLNNARFDRFDDISEPVRAPIERAVSEAFGGGRNLARFW